MTESRHIPLASGSVIGLLLGVAASRLVSAIVYEATARTRSCWRLWSSLCCWPEQSQSRGRWDARCFGSN